MIKKSIKKFFKIDKKAKKYAQQILENQNFIPISETMDNDIFIAGYPKSGNTWVQNLIAGLLFGIETSLLTDKLTQEIVPDLHGKKFYLRFNDFNFFKTHNLPQKKMKRVIHLVRDGRDVMASYYAMNTSLKKNSTLEEMIKYGKDIYPCKWHNHTRDWLNNPFNAEILIIKYENLLLDPENELKKILKFAGLERSDEIINRVIEGNSFNEMQRKERENGWYNKNWDTSEKFIRKGKKGTYKTEIPEELINYFEKEAQFELEYFDYI